MSPSPGGGRSAQGRAEPRCRRRPLLRVPVSTETPAPGPTFWAAASSRLLGNGARANAVGATCQDLEAERGASENRETPECSTGAAQSSSDAELNAGHHSMCAEAFADGLLFCLSALFILSFVLYRSCGTSGHMSSRARLFLSDYKI